MNKFERDLQKGHEDRLKVIAFVNARKSCVKLETVHAFLNPLTVAEKKINNTIKNRITDMSNGKNMGLDCILKCRDVVSKVTVIIRWFSDPDIYIKDTTERDLVQVYEDSLILLVNQPKDGEDYKITHYHVLSIAKLRRNYSWRNENNKKNTNRLVMVSNTGKVLRANNFSSYPVDGERNLLSNIPCLWSKLKTFCI